MYRATPISYRARQTRSTSQVSQVRNSPVSAPAFARLSSSPGMTAAEVLDSRFCAQPRDSDQEEEYQDTLRATAAQEQQAQDHFWQRWSRQPTTQSELSEYRQDRRAAGLSPVSTPPLSVSSSSPSQKSHRPSLSFLEEDDTKMSSPLAGVYSDALKHTNVAPGSNASRDLGEEDLDIVASSGIIALSDLDEDPITNVAPGSNASRDLGRDIFSGSNAQLQGVNRRRTTSPSQDIVEQPRPKRSCVKPAYRELARLSDSEDEVVTRPPLTKGKSKAAPKAQAMPKNKGKGKAVARYESDDDVFDPEVIQDPESDEYLGSPVRGVQTRRTTRSRGKSTAAASESEDSDDVPLRLKFAKGKKLGQAKTPKPDSVPCVRAEITSVVVKMGSGSKGKQVHPGLTNKKDQTRRKGCEAWEYESLPAPGYFTAIRAPRGFITAINPGSLTLHGVLPQMLSTAYELRKSAFPDEDNSWMDVFPPGDFSKVAIDGMTPESVQIMSRGKPWAHEELFFSLPDFAQAAYRHGVYNVRVMQADPDEPAPVNGQVKLLLHNYAGSCANVAKKMMMTRGESHFEMACHRKESNKALYQLMNEPNTRAEMKAVSILSTDIFNAYGPSPVKLLETCFIDLFGGWLSDTSLALDRENERWSSIHGDKINLLPESWLDNFKNYADPSARSSRAIMKSALQCRGLNKSSPIFEEHRTSDRVYLRLTEGAIVYLRHKIYAGKDQGFQLMLAPAFTLMISPEQRKEINALGHKESSKGKNDGTPSLLQIHVAAADDERHWANTSSAKPEYEMARRILLSLTWTNTDTGDEVVYYLKRSRVTTSDLTRARHAMSMLEYANGTLLVGTESPANRCDFGSCERNNAKVLDQNGVLCPGSDCEFLHSTSKRMKTHFKNNPDCKTKYDELSADEQYDFRFFECRNCGDLFPNLDGMAGHIRLGKQRNNHPACAAWFKAEFGDDAEPDQFNCGRFR